MRRILAEKVKAAIIKAKEAGLLNGSDDPPGLTVEVPKIATHGDWSTNAAMVMAKAEKKSPRDISKIIIDHIDDPEGYIERIDVAGPGFINFTLSRKWWESVVRDILAKGEAYGRNNSGQGRKIQVEFVSANPTGPLHVGHGRGAAIGDSLARILTAAGHDVSREYYVNDAGRQMQTLGRSVLYRYLELHGQTVDFHKDLYQGDYIRDLAVTLKNDHGDKYLALPEERAVEEIYPWAASCILETIKQDLENFGISYDCWFSEKSLYENNAVDQTIADMRERGRIYDQDGAVWFSSSALGDDKDRVLIKSTGEKTYFASDIAYHRDKYRRGFDLVINLWGADHHGYVPRMKSAVQALGYSPDQLEVLMVQLVSLTKGGEPVAMSTRAGQFETLKDVLDEVGSDAARFFFLTRSSDSHLDFDLDVAKSQSADNPVYYVQYAHARIASVFLMAADKGRKTTDLDQADLGLLEVEEELSLIRHLAAFPDVVSGAAANLEPHRLTHYLTELAKKFHPYYYKYKFIGDDPRLTEARLALSAAAKQILANGLYLLGISAPEKM